jgi:hypothetical protein
MWDCRFIYKLLWVTCFQNIAIQRRPQFFICFQRRESVVNYKFCLWFAVSIVFVKIEQKQQWIVNTRFRYIDLIG